MSQLFQVEYPIVNIFIIYFRYRDLGESHDRLKKAALISATVIFSLVLLINVAPQSPLVTAAEVSQRVGEQTAERIAKNEQYLADLDALLGAMFAEERKINDYEQQLENASSEQQRQDIEEKIQESRDKIAEILEQINSVEKLNQALFVVDPALESKIYSVEKDLADKYVFEDSGKYIGENPVESVEADMLNRTVVILVNPDKVVPDGSNLPTEKNIDGIPIQIRYGKFELI